MATRFDSFNDAEVGILSLALSFTRDAAIQQGLLKLTREKSAINDLMMELRLELNNRVEAEVNDGDDASDR